MWNCINWDVSLQQKHTAAILKKELWQAKWGSKVSGPSRGRDSNRTKARSGCISLFLKGTVWGTWGLILEERAATTQLTQTMVDIWQHSLRDIFMLVIFIICKTCLSNACGAERRVQWVLNLHYHKKVRVLFCERLQRLPPTNQVIWLDNQKVSKDSSFLSRDVFIQKSPTTLTFGGYSI